MKLFAANDNNIDVLGLQDEAGNFIVDATLSCAVTDAVTGSSMGAAVTLAYLGAGVAVGSYADGNYRGVLPAATALVAGSTYKLAITASNYGLAINTYVEAVERLG